MRYWNAKENEVPREELKVSIEPMRYWN